MGAVRRNEPSRLPFAARIVAGALLVVLIWFGSGRLLAGQSAVQTWGPEGVDDGVARNPASRIRVAAYNIAHGRGLSESNWAGERQQRITEIASVLERLDADVVVLNEVDFNASWSGGWNQAEEIAEQAGYPWRAEQRNYDLSLPFLQLKFGNAVLSRYPIVDATLIALPPIREWEPWLYGQKHAVVCTLDLGAGRRVRVLAVHLETRSAEVRNQSIEQLVHLAGTPGGPVVLAGDFNTTVDEVERIAGDRLRSPAGLGSVQGTFPSTRPTRWIDHIWAAPPAEVVRFEVVPEASLSDHRPVEAEVDLGFD